MKKAILMLTLAFNVINSLWAQHAIGINVGLTNYGSQFIDKINGTNWVNQNNKSFEYAISYRIMPGTKRDYEIRLGYTNRMIDHIENSSKYFELNQDYLSLSLLSHKKIVLIDNKMVLGVGGGCFSHVLLIETKHVVENNSNPMHSRNFGEIFRLGLVGDIPIEFHLNKQSSLVISHQIGFDFFSNIKMSNLIYFNQYIGIQYKF